MKKKTVLILISSLLFLFVTGCGNKANKDTVATDTNASPTSTPTVTSMPTEPADIAASASKVTTAPDVSASAYKDGTYEVKTDNDSEGYYTKATVIIENGKITLADWCIYDSLRDDMPFDENYYTVFDDEIYQQQSKDDYSGSRDYTSEYIETQDLNQVDAVSGATWTNEHFKTVIKLALLEASK
jgi:major membrane immunogen (membrane-anchored lipoprotein)